MTLFPAPATKREIINLCERVLGAGQRLTFPMNP
jgi:hypothetical protein